MLSFKTDGIFVPGPIEPTTYRGRAGVENSAAASFASRTFRLLISATAWAIPNSPRAIVLALNVFVSTASQPTAKYPLWISRIQSGRVRARASDRFIRDLPSGEYPQSASVGLYRWRLVPMPPSRMRTRSFSTSRNGTGMKDSGGRTYPLEKRIGGGGFGRLAEVGERKWPAACRP
jgi:hypothetical protein